MSTHNICFCVEIRKIAIPLVVKRALCEVLNNIISLFVLRFYGPVNPMGSC